MSALTKLLSKTVKRPFFGFLAQIDDIDGDTIYVSLYSKKKPSLLVTDVVLDTSVGWSDIPVLLEEEIDRAEMSSASKKRWIEKIDPDDTSSWADEAEKTIDFEDAKEEPSASASSASQKSQLVNKLVAPKGIKPTTDAELKSAIKSGVPIARIDANEAELQKMWVTLLQLNRRGEIEDGQRVLIEGMLKDNEEVERLEKIDQKVIQQLDEEFDQDFVGTDEWLERMNALYQEYSGYSKDQFDEVLEEKTESRDKSVKEGVRSSFDKILAKKKDMGVKRKLGKQRTVSAKDKMGLLQRLDEKMKTGRIKGAGDPRKESDFVFMPASDLPKGPAPLPPLPPRPTGLIPVKQTRRLGKIQSPLRKSEKID